MLDDDGPYGDFAWRILSRSLSYAASLIPEVGDDPVAIDDAMKLGYNWIQGPFELIDEIGVDRFIDRREPAARNGSQNFSFHDLHTQFEVTINQRTPDNVALGYIVFVRYIDIFVPHERGGLHNSGVGLV